MSIRDSEPRTKNQEPRTIIIRPELAAPEVDDYDEVLVSDIVEKDIDIGSYVAYTLSE